MRKRILSVLITLSVLLTLLPAVSVPALAGASSRNVMDGISGIDGDQESNVYFGTYRQSSDGEGGFLTDPIRWRVLDDGGAYYAEAAGLTAEEFGEDTYYIYNSMGGGFVIADSYAEATTYYERQISLFLLADKGLDARPFDTAQEHIAWKGGTVRSWLNGYETADTNGANAANPYEDSFIGAAFSARERAAVAEAALSGSVHDKVYFLSDGEAGGYGFGSNLQRQLYKTDYVSSLLDDGSDTAGWWLRTDTGSPDSEVDCVSSGGDITRCYANYGYNAVRPALNIDRDSVLFSEAADTDISLFTRTSPSADSDWKLTLKDGNTGFAASMSVPVILLGSTATVEVSSLGNGYDYSQISAMLLRSGDIQCYGSIGTAAAGVKTFDIPADLSVGSYTLRLFAEDRGGAYATGFASNTVDIPVEITDDAPNVYVGGQDVTGAAGAVTYWLNDNAGGLTDTGAGAGNFNVKYEAYTRTLTLKNVNLTGVHSDFLSPDYEEPSAASIFTLWYLNIVLEGESRIEPTSGGGIITARGLDFGGDGSLFVNAREEGAGISVDAGDISIHSGSIEAKGTYAIHSATGDISIYGGNVTAAGAWYGIYSYEGNVNINGGMISVECLDEDYGFGVAAYEGSVTVCGGTLITKAVEGTNYCYGIYSQDNLEILGGAVYAQGGTCAVFSHGDISPSAAYDKCAVIMTKEDAGAYTPTVLYNNATAPVIYNPEDLEDTEGNDLWVGGFPFCTDDAALWTGVVNNTVYGDFFHDGNSTTADGSYAWRVGYDTNDEGYDLYLNGICIREATGYPNRAGICANRDVDMDLFLEGASSSDIVPSDNSQNPGGIIVENGALRIYGTGTLNIRAVINAISVEGGDMTIEGGTINAAGGTYMAGIGVYDGSLTINDATVSAYGLCGVITTAGTIAVAGGTLTAKGSGAYGAVYALNQVNAPSLEGTAILGAETGGSVSGGVYTAGTRVSDLTHITWADSAYREDGAILTYVRIAPANAVTCVADANGSFTAKTDGVIITHAATGDTVTLTAAPAAGYTLSSWSVYKTGDTSTVVSVSGNAFTMPAYAVTVEAVFTEETAATYAITRAHADNGSFTVSVGGAAAENAAAGDTVTLTAAPAAGYTLSSWSVYKTGDTGTAVSVSGNAFTMPAYAVTVVASFRTVTTTGGATAPTITVTEVSSELFGGAQGMVMAEANMDNAFSSSVEVKVTDTDERASGFGFGIGETVYPFDISLYIKGTSVKTEPRDGYAVTLYLPIPNNLLDMKERISIAHKADDGSVTTLPSRLRQINGAWYLVFEATDFSPYALVVSGTDVYNETAGLPYHTDAEGNDVFIGFAAGGKYIAPPGVTVRFRQNTKAFMDIGTHWAKDCIGFVTEREIFLGTGGDAFSPNSGMTRAMFATVIGRLYERSFGVITAGSDHAFTDCDYDAYYGKYVDWAAESKIMSGYGNSSFGPDDQITREQMAAILYRFADFLGVLPVNMADTLNYSDAGSISSWAENAARYCQTQSIMTGRDGGRFAPQETATRAEVSAIIQRFVESVLK